MALSIVPAVRAQVGLVEAGRDVFIRECAKCHGHSGRGYGPLSWVLRDPPSDLTLLSSMSTPFPRTDVRDTLTGRIRLVPSHGPSQMPYWRGTLDTEIPGSGGFTNMSALLLFLEHIQSRPYRAKPGLTNDDIVAAGARLFKERCAACHQSGRRLPTREYVLGIEPPDLTTLKARYSGPMNVGRIFEMIARCHEPQLTDMPSWYHSLERAGWPRTVIVKNLEAIAAYVESTQRW
jgi:mono/diheme cytochrome c family protein